MIFRTCKYCGIQATTEEDLQLFVSHPNAKYGRTNECKQCRVKVYNKQYYNEYKNKEQKRNSEYIRKYGITLEEYNGMFETQNGKCAICKNKDTSHNSIHLNVDHCHTTGEVRGLLCGHCNKALGGFRDNIHYLESAIEYLKRY